MRPHTAVVLAAGAALVAGCRRTPTAPEPVLHVSTTVAPAAFRAGEPVVVTITVANAGAQTRRLAADLCPDPFEITTAAGDAVAPASRWCELVLRPPRVLAPGERAVIAYGWRGDAGPAWTSSHSAPVPLAPGEYRLRAFVQDAESADVYRAAPVAIRVTP